MTYYVGTMPVGEHLSHHGIKGMKWGQRRYQNPDGSLTAAGRVRYGISNAYGRARSGVRSAGNRAGSWYKKNKKTIRRVAAGVGTAAAVAGAAYLGKRYGKSALKAAGKLHTRVGMMRGMTGGAFKKAGRGISSAAGRIKRSKAVTGARMAGYEALGRVDNAFQSGKKTAKHLGNKMYLAGNNVRTRAGMARGMVGGAFKKAGRGAKNAFGNIKRSKAVTNARMAGYEALGRVDNAVQRIKRGGAEFDAKYAYSRVKGAARKAGGAVKGAASKAKSGAKRATAPVRGAYYEALGRVDNAIQNRQRLKTAAKKHASGSYKAFASRVNKNKSATKKAVGRYSYIASKRGRVANAANAAKDYVKRNYKELGYSFGGGLTVAGLAGTAHQARKYRQARNRGKKSRR